MSSNRNGPSYAHCNICAIDLSVGGGGLCEVKRHMESKHHRDGVKAFTNQAAASMTSLLSQKKQSLNEQVTTAELYFTILIAEHNLAFSAGDHFTKLCKKMFPNSKIAEGFACGATRHKPSLKMPLLLHSMKI